MSQGNDIQPGIYMRGDVQYHAIQGINFSTLKHLAVSPLRYRHRLRAKQPETQGMRLGVAAHTAVLEPNRFMRDYVMYEPPAGKTARRGTNAWKECVEANPGKTVIKEDEFMQAIAIRDAVRRHPVANRYLEHGRPEIALAWKDRETGLVCKGRVDWNPLEPLQDTLVDLKSGADVAPFRFCRSAASLMYHMQLAFYSDGYETLTGKRPDYRVIAVEQAAPHDVVVYRLPDEVIDVGRDEYRKLLTRLIECRRDNDWPGIAPDGELDFQLPPWLLQDDNELDDLGLEF